MTPETREAIHFDDVLATITARLEAAGGWIELLHLTGMSQSELDLLVLAELEAAEVAA